MSMINNADGMAIHYVDDTAAFNSLCDQWRNTEYLAIDTEFVRTSTFYPIIGLLQIADETSCYLVDPLKIDDWSAFSDLLVNSQCCFVIHSCSEDLNLLQIFLGCLPAKLFDTQLAAAFLGMGLSVSYQALVSELLGIGVAKDETRSDWTKRPLTEAQILYAATDVRYLLQVQGILKNRLIEKGMLQWFEAECERQKTSAAGSEVEKHWESFYIGLSNAWKLDDPGLILLQRLCYWREQEARTKNKPRNWIVKDNELLKLANDLSQTEKISLDAVMAVQEVDRRFLSRYGNELLHLLVTTESGLERINRDLLNKPLSAALRKKLKQCQKIVSIKAEELEMAPELLGRKKQLLELFRDYERAGQIEWTGEFSGWRRHILEAEFLLIMSGEV
ncbi:MAG: ribonuclease D [Pseudohongiella sp.]|nr:ribonuclease D [Pseudohongiella sp.]